MKELDVLLEENKGGRERVWRCFSEGKTERT
jgi:hypothetical protein